MEWVADSDESTVLVPLWDVMLWRQRRDTQFLMAGAVYLTKNSQFVSNTGDQSKH